jgi:acetate kinase
MAVGHRVAHGGEAYARPVRITPDIIQVLTGLIPLVPLHQPNNLAAIRAVAAATRPAAGGLLRHRLPSRATDR